MYDVDILTIDEARQKFKRTHLAILRDGVRTYPEYTDALGAIWTPVHESPDGKGEVIGYRKYGPNDHLLAASARSATEA